MIAGGCNRVDLVVWSSVLTCPPHIGASSTALGVCGERKEHHGCRPGPGPAASHPPPPLLRAGDRGCWGEVLHRPRLGQKGECSPWLLLTVPARGDPPTDVAMLVFVLMVLCSNLQNTQRHSVPERGLMVVCFSTIILHFGFSLWL